MLLASKICNNRYCFAVGRPLLTGNRRPFPRRSRGVAIQSDSPATQRFHAGSLILDLAATTTASATVPLREFWKLQATLRSLFVYILRIIVGREAIARCASAETRSALLLAFLAVSILAETIRARGVAFADGLIHGEEARLSFKFRATGQMKYLLLRIVGHNHGSRDRTPLLLPRRVRLIVLRRQKVSPREQGQTDRDRRRSAQGPGQESTPARRCSVPYPLLQSSPNVVRHGKHTCIAIDSDHIPRSVEKRGTLATFLDMRFKSHAHERLQFVVNVVREISPHFLAAYSHGFLASRRDHPRRPSWPSP